MSPGTRKKGTEIMEAVKEILWWLVSIILIALFSGMVTYSWKADELWKGVGIMLAYPVFHLSLYFCYDQAWKGIVDEKKTT